MKFDITVTYKQLQRTRYFREMTAILHLKALTISARTFHISSLFDLIEI